MAASFRWLLEAASRQVERLCNGQFLATVVQIREGVPSDAQRVLCPVGAYAVRVSGPVSIVQHAGS